MPTTAGGVVDAFKNLIRHGKNHHHARHENKPSDDEQVSPSSPIGFSHQQQQAQQQPKQQHVPPSREVAEIIVNEEREARLKMPSYRGLENFNITLKMGDGAFSDVYKAVDLKTTKQRAVKVVRKFELNSSQASDRHLNPKFKKRPPVTERNNILKEVQIMRAINHPSIIKLIAFSESPEYYFLVLELMDGGELFHQIVKLTYFSENLSRHVILQVAHGIRYLHEECGVVHRDIKPENLLFERIPIVPSNVPLHRQYDEKKEDEGEFIPGVGGGGIGRVKIADFGLSKVVWNEETMTPCGTVGYTAPEIVKDERYSKSVDMWALGCVLYTLLCGFPPFYDESINVLTEKVAKGSYTFLSPWWDDISHSSKDLIEHLLCVDPDQRFTIDEFLIHPWCNADPAPPPPPTPFTGIPFDSPLLTAARGGRVEARSPELATLKDAFEITYALHRMEEEGARRRKYNGRGVAGVQGFLSGLNEDDEEGEGEGDDDGEDEGEGVRGRTQAPTRMAHKQPGNPSPGDLDTTVGKVPPKVQAPVQVQKPRQMVAGHGYKAKRFELDIHGSTLLGRRNQQRARSPFALGNPLARAIGGMRVEDT